MFWKRFPKNKPKEDGWYACTLRFNYTEDPYTKKTTYQTYVMNLYWYGKRNEGKGRWIDNIRQHVFDSYHVYSDDPYNPLIKSKCDRIRTIDLCDRTDEVVAWKKLPKAYIWPDDMKSKIKESALFDYISAIIEVFD